MVWARAPFRFSGSTKASFSLTHPHTYVLPYDRPVDTPFFISRMPRISGAYTIIYNTYSTLSEWQLYPYSDACVLLLRFRQPSSTRHVHIGETLYSSRQQSHPWSDHVFASGRDLGCRSHMVPRSASQRLCQPSAADHSHYLPSE